MRISSSSSTLLLATLAISSSSTTLAAPTEPGSLEHSSLASSSSVRSVALAGRGDEIDVNFGGSSYGSHMQSNAAPSVDMTHFRRDLDLVGLLSGLPAVGPILGPLLQNILGAIGLQQKTGAAAEAISSAPTPQQLSMILQLLANAHQKLSTVAAAAQRRDIADYSSMSTSSTSGSSSPPISPGVCAGANVSAPVAPPSGPPKGTPPMFSAADASMSSDSTNTDAMSTSTTSSVTLAPTTTSTVLPRRLPLLRRSSQGPTTLLHELTSAPTPFMSRTYR